ncbi:hypothetical protein RB195_016904 [Necator americanus]|uniref:Uncharacterized protein n=1 Tax=Necator americanus TaxID=51031 RepID=A0ABR1C550_NECAM
MRTRQWSHSSPPFRALYAPPTFACIKGAVLCLEIHSINMSPGKRQPERPREVDRVDHEQQHHFRAIPSAKREEGSWYGLEATGVLRLSGGGGVEPEVYTCRGRSQWLVRFCPF